MRAQWVIIALVAAGCGGNNESPNNIVADGGANNVADMAGGPDGSMPNSNTTPDIGGPDQSNPGMDMGGGGDDMARDDMGIPPTPAGCEPLPVEGNVIDVTPADAGNLRDIVANAPSGSTIMLADGTYMLDGGDASSRIQLTTDNVTLRGASGDASAVVLDGGYATNEIVTIHANDVTVAHLTITRAVDHLIHVTPGGATITGTHIHDVRFIDGGEQFIKINSDGSGTNWADDGEVSCSYFELTDAGRPNIERNPGGCYTGGIDAHSARGWHVHHNRFVDIYCAGEGLAEHAVHFWSASRDTLTEQNIILNCARGIGYGLVENGADRTYGDDPYPNVGYMGHIDGIIRNNVIYADHDFYDTGIELAQAQGVRVLHNTVVNPDGLGGFFSSIDYRFANTDAEIVNNLTRRITMRNGASGTLSSNMENTDLAMFEDAASGDFHLVSGAAAVDAGEDVAGAGLDIDDEPHTNAAPDIGADER